LSIFELTRSPDRFRSILESDTSEARAESDYTPLYLAAEYGHVEWVKLLLDASPKEKDEESINSRSPLHVAAKQGYVEVAKLLLDSGRDIDVLDHFDATPLSVAITSEQVDIIELLLDRGADTNKIPKPIWGIFVKSLAVAGRIETVKELLKHVADSLPVANIWPALRGAAINGHMGVVRALLDASSMHDLTQSFGNNIEFLEYLISAYPNERGFQLALGYEYMRQKRYSEAKLAFDLSTNSEIPEYDVTRADTRRSGFSCEACEVILPRYCYKCVQCPIASWRSVMCKTCAYEHFHPRGDIIMIRYHDSFGVTL
jgi:ankyrin repeat protein